MVYCYWHECASQNHDVYAAWTLLPDALAAEVARVDVLMAQQGVQPETRGAFTRYVDMQSERDLQPTEAHVFAYNPVTGEVRCAVCSRCEDDVPFWLQQDWGESLPEFAETP